MKVRHYYDSPESFLAALDDRPIQAGILGDQMSSNDGNKNWNGTDSYVESIKLAKYGDNDIAKTIKPKDVSMHAHGAMNTIVYDYAGDSVDMGRYMCGEPECMMSLRKKGKPIINILVNIAASNYINARVIQARGKTILEIMSGLETNGYGVDITICNEVNRGDYRLTIKVKDAKEYFNLPSLAYWLVNPSVLRRLYFRHVEQEPSETQRKLGSGYGRPFNIAQEELDAMPDCVYFPIVTDNDTGQYERAINQIMETYKA